MYAAARMQWTTGDNSGGDDGLYGTAALAGFNAGDGISYKTISGSLEISIRNIVYVSNVDIPGTWIFKVGGVCNNHLQLLGKYCT